MTIKKLFYSELRNFLQSKSIDIESIISNDSYFSGISSLELAKEIVIGDDLKLLLTKMSNILDDDIKFSKFE